jgi:predicted RNase H-like HicB family nuclease
MKAVERIVYTATAERTGKWWALSVPEIPGVHTQVRRLDLASAMVREAIALMLDVPEDSFDVRILSAFDTKVTAVVENLELARDEARLAEKRLAAATRQTVRVLTTQEGLTVRDAGVVMGVSFQRVSQVMKQLGETDDLAEESGEFGESTFGNGAVAARPKVVRRR